MEAALPRKFNIVNIGMITRGYEMFSNIDVSH